MELCGVAPDQQFGTLSAVWLMRRKLDRVTLVTGANIGAGVRLILGSEVIAVTALLVAVTAWLVVGFGLPAADHLPTVEFASPQAIAGLRYEALMSADRRELLPTYRGASEKPSRQVVSVYDSRRETIVLPDGWTGTTPGEMSILVHEMVHHLQHEGGLRYACPQEREQVAYHAQEKWLRLFGRSLASEFEIDVLTLLVSTHCIP